MRFRRSPFRGAIASSSLLLTIIAWCGEPGAAELMLTWVDNSGGQALFSIERSTVSTGPFAEIGGTGPGGTAYTDTTVADATSYCYRVRAYNALGSSEYSNIACAATGSAVSSFIAGSYRVVLGRVPGAAELSGWAGFLAANCNSPGLQTVADAFFDSQEYRARPMTLTGLVMALYGALLARAPDPAGLAQWTGLFREGRVDVARSFIGSTEFQGLVPDRRNPALVTPVVTRFYTAILGRAPDPAGLQSWVDYIVTTLDLEGTAVTFLTSSEFETRPLTSRDFVEILYGAFFGREPDPSGWDAWDAVVRGGLLNAIDAGFIPSGEFQARIHQVCGS